MKVFILNKYLKIRKIKNALKNKLSPEKILNKILETIQSFLYFYEIKIQFILFLKTFNLINKKKFNKPIFLYDLRTMPLTFDFGDTLFKVSYWLKKIGLEKCDCVIFANKDDFIPMKFRSYNLLFSKEELWARIDNILIPLAESANFINDIKLISEKNELDKILKDNFIIYPPYYANLKKFNLVIKGEPLRRFRNFIRNKNSFFHIMNFSEPKVESIESVKQILKISNKDKIVTFTVRDYEFEPIRNTNYRYVKDLYEFFNEHGYRFIVIPDHKNQKPNIDIEIFSEAANDTKKRIALYNLAKINIATTGGPAWLARYMPGVNMFITHILKNGNHIGSYKDLKGFYGKDFTWGCQPFQEYDMHLIYGPEDCISKLTENNRLKQIMRLNKLI